MFNLFPRSIGRTLPAGWVWVVLCTFFLSACRITDHSEIDGAIGTEMINHPGSGYEEVDPDELPRMTFDAPKHDMGTVIQGAQIEHRIGT